MFKILPIISLDVTAATGCKENTMSINPCHARSSPVKKKDVRFDSDKIQAISIA